MNLVSRKALMGAMASLVVAVPGVAFAETLVSVEGNDYSYNSIDRRIMYACDYEADSHGVHADYYNNGLYGRLDDSNGSGNSCGGRDLLSLRVSQHRIVEGVPFRPDYYGPWVYPRP